MSTPRRGPIGLFALPLHEPEFRLEDAFLDRYAGRQPEWGPVGYVTFKRTYARTQDAHGGSAFRLTSPGESEEWWQTLARVVEGTYQIQQRHCALHNLHWRPEKAQASAQTMFELMWSFRFLPPGRGLWMMGTDYIRSHGSAALNNCAFTSTRDIHVDFSRPFTFLMDMSMLGVGVGFDTDGRGKLSLSAPTRTDDVHVIPDHREGWIDAVRRVLDAYVGRQSLPARFDYDGIRPAGEPIRGFGGVAAGPEPLRRLIEQDLPRVLDAAVDRPIPSQALVDIANLIGRCVVAGNVRRSAEIAFGEPDDEEFLSLKDPETAGEALSEWRWTSNNSVRARLGMDYRKLADQTAKNGEPGYLWLDNARAYGRMLDPPDYRDARVAGANPCVTGDTLVHTDRGLRRIDSLVGSPFTTMVDGRPYRSTDAGAFVTGRKPVYLLKTVEGHQLKLTANHKVLVASRVTSETRYTTWIEAGDLRDGDLLVLSNQRDLREPDAERPDDPRSLEGWLVGTLLGERRSRSSRDEEDGEASPQLREAEAMLEQLVAMPAQPVERVGDRGPSPTGQDKLWSHAAELGVDPTDGSLDAERLLTRDPAFIRGFVAGLFDAHGSVDGAPSIRLTSDDEQHLRVAQQMLLSLGINSTLYRSPLPSIAPHRPDNRDGIGWYDEPASMDLVVGKDNLALFADVVPLRDRRKRDALLGHLEGARRSLRPERFVATFASLTYLGVETVYDCTIPEQAAHRFTADGFVVHNCVEQSLEDQELCCLVETFPAHHDGYEDYERTLKWAYLYAKTVTLLPTHDPRANAVLLRNRRIGTSQSGIVQNFARVGRREHFRWCDEGYRYLREVDATYSEWLAVPTSIKITSVKPSGTVSKLCGATSGIHYPPARYYVQRIRFPKNSPLLVELEAAGYPVEPDHYNATSAVVEFPVEEKNFTKGADEVSMWEQMLNAVQMQRYWADNQVSCTISFDPAEAPQIGDALELLEDQLKGVSFLPRSGHGFVQAPWEPISETEYHRRRAAIRPLGPVTEDTDAEPELYCDGDRCKLVG